MSAFPILTFNTIFKSVLWGGKRIANEEEVIADCNFFTTTALAVEGEKSIDLSARDSFTIVIATEGTATIVGADNAVTKLTQGNAALIPASMPNITVCGNGRLVTTFIK